LSQAERSKTLAVNAIARSREEEIQDRVLIVRPFPNSEVTSERFNQLSDRL
jgi:hypothetical protein